MQPLLDKPENYYNGPEITSLWVWRCQNPSFGGQIKSPNVGEKLRLWIWIDYFGNGCVFGRINSIAGAIVFTC